MTLPLRTSGNAERKVALAETPVALIKEVRCVDGSIFIICWTTESEFMSKKKSDGKTVIWSYDALFLAKRNAGVSLDAKFSIDLRPATFKVSLSYCCKSIAVSPPVCHPPS